MKHYLSVFLENEKQKTILLNSLSSFDNGEIKIGRADDNDIILPFPSVSRHHAVIKFMGDVVEIVDAGSLNKIRVNGTAYSRIRLSPGMNVTIGTSNTVITLRYTCEGDQKEAINPSKRQRQAASTITNESSVETVKKSSSSMPRLIAALADFVIGMFMCIGAATIILAAFKDLKLIVVVTLLLCIAVFWMYYSIGESGATGATMGKLMLGLKVVSNQTGENLTFNQSTKRFFAKFLSALILFVGFLPIFSGKRPLHDVVSGARVIKRDVEQ